MPNLKTNVFFYEHGGISLVAVDFAGGYLSISELNALYQRAEQVDELIYGKVAVHTFEEPQDLDQQILGILPRMGRIKRQDMERLVRDILPANCQYHSEWRTNIKDPIVQLALMMRKQLLG